jgi:hypothetical protein
MTAEARQHNPIDINKQRMLSTQNPTQDEGSQAEGHTQILNLDDWIITCKDYKPGSDKPQSKIVRPIYVTPIKKNPDAQVDLPKNMMEQSEEWRNHNDGRVDKL